MATGSLIISRLAGPLALVLSGLFLLGLIWAEPFRYGHVSGLYWFLIPMPVVVRWR